MEFNIGDTVRIVSDPNIWFFGGGDYEIGDIATIEAFEYLGSNLFGIAPEVTLGDSVIITDEVGQETVVIDCMWVECSDYGMSETDDIYVAGKLSNYDAMCGALGHNAIPVTKQYTLF